MNIGDKVFIYKIRLNFSKNTVEQEKEQYTVIGTNKRRLCIDNSSFSSMEYEPLYKGDISAIFNKVDCCDLTNCLWSNESRLYGTLWTDIENDKTAYNKIKKELEKYIAKKLSFYGGCTQLLEQIKL